MIKLLIIHNNSQDQTRYRSRRGTRKP